PYPDTTIYLGNSVDIHSEGGGTYSWFPPTWLNCDNCQDVTSLLPQDTITYYLTVTSPEGCKTIDSITVNVRWDALVVVPSAFSPNSDGHNDLLRLLVRGVFVLDHFYLFNRWGERVYETSNMQ